MPKASSNPSRQRRYNLQDANAVKKTAKTLRSLRQAGSPDVHDPKTAEATLAVDEVLATPKVILTKTGMVDRRFGYEDTNPLGLKVVPPNELMDDASRIPASDTRMFQAKTRGKHSRMGLTRFVIEILIANEQRYLDFRRGKLDSKDRPIRPLSNTQLKATILTEFAHEENTVRSFHENNQSIEKLRTEYHNGKLCNGSFPPEKPGYPPIFTFRYNEDGYIIKNSHKSGKVPLTNGGIMDMVNKRDKVQENYEQVMLRIGRKKRDWYKREAVE